MTAVCRAMDWDNPRHFHEAADAGIFTRRRCLESESINCKSADLGARRFAANAALPPSCCGLLLTEQRKLLYGTVHEVFHMLAMAEAQLSER